MLQYTSGAASSAPLTEGALSELIQKILDLPLEPEFGRLVSGCCGDDVRLGKKFGEAWCEACGNVLFMSGAGIPLKHRVLSMFVPPEFERLPTAAISPMAHPIKNTREVG